MKRKIIAALILGALMIQPAVIASAKEADNSQEETLVQQEFDKINKIEFGQTFKVGEPEYVVYYYMNRCGYCNSIKDEVMDFASQLEYKNIYAVQMELSSNKSGWYNMREHHAKYDIEIGKIDKSGSVTYYNGENEEKYLNSKDITYEIVRTDSEHYEKYKKSNKNAQPDRVYAVDYTPRIDLTNTDSFKVEGTPTAIWVKDNKIKMCGIGTDEVLDVFNKVKESGSLTK
jgi:hypothetical protein